MRTLQLTVHITGKNNGFPILDIFGYLKNTHKTPKFGRVRQILIREFPTKFPNWDLSHSPKFGILWVFFKYPKKSKIGNPLFFPVYSCSGFCGRYLFLVRRGMTVAGSLERREEEMSAATEI